MATARASLAGGSTSLVRRSSQLSTSLTEIAPGPSSSSSSIPPLPDYSLGGAGELDKVDTEHTRRRLKRKEQNRLAQRRRREKQRSGLIPRKPRTGSGGSSREGEEQSEEAYVKGVEARALGAEGQGSKSGAPAKTDARGGEVSLQLRDQGNHQLSPNSSVQEQILISCARDFEQFPPLQQHCIPQDLSDASGRHSASISSAPASSSTFAAASASFSSDHRFSLDQQPYWGASLHDLPAAAGHLVAPGNVQTSSPWNPSELSSTHQDSPYPLSQRQSPLSMASYYHPPSSFQQSWQPGVKTDSPQSQHCQIAADQRELTREFVTLVSQRIPWKDQLLLPRWDMIKVLRTAAMQLGLLFDYIEEDDSISFLEEDFRAAMTKRIVGSVSGDSLSGEEIDQDRKQDLFTSDLNETGVRAAPDDQTSRATTTISVLRWKEWPSNMNPSRLCGIVSHHPFLDLAFPWPRTRDKILAAISCDFLNEKSFCDDVWPGQPTEDGSFAEPPYIVHGDDAFDTAAYEVSNRFALRYAPLIDAHICRRTNWWRRQSGKEELPRSIVEIANYFETFFSAQIRHLLQPERNPTPMKPPMRLPLPIQLLSSGTSMLNGQAQAVPPRWDGHSSAAGGS